MRNLQAIMGGDVAHTLVRFWSEELSEAEAAAIHTQAQRDSRYREDLDGLLGIFAAMEGLAGDRAMQELAGEPRRLLQERRRRTRIALGLAAGMLFAVGAVLAVFSPWQGASDRALPMHFTRIGEQQTIELADGSVVTLNTGSQLLVDYSASARRVLLERGEAYFEVARDPDRAFRVDLGLRSVTVVGTAFNIRKDPQHYQVAVAEGAVAIHEPAEDVSPSPPPVPIRGFGPLRVEAGWVAEFDVARNELTAVRTDSVDRYGEWRSGVLSFYYEPLSQVVRELNRYSRRKILIEDTSVMNLRVYSIIRVTGIDAALHGLEQALPIEVERYYDRIVITASTGTDNQ